MTYGDRGTIKLKSALTYPLHLRLQLEKVGTTTFADTPNLKFIVYKA